MKTLLKKFQFIKIFFISIFSLFLFLSFPLNLAQAAPSALTFQAKIFKPDGTPLTSSAVNFNFKFTDILGTCVLYEESFSNVDLSATEGTVSISLGVPPSNKLFPLDSTALKDIFAYGNILSCKGGIPSANITPVLSDKRFVIVEFSDGVVTKTLPAMSVNSVPYALHANVAANANQLGGFVASLYPKFSDFTSAGCTAGQALRYNGTAFVCETIGSGSGTVTNLSSANSYVTVTNPTTTPQLTLNVGTLANTVAAGNDSRITGALQASSNLSDLGSISTARTNLGLGASALLNIGTSAGTVAAGDDSRITSALQSGSSSGGDLSGTYPNPTVANVGGKTSAQVATAVDDTLAATNLNTPSTLVKRDGSGNITTANINSANITASDLLVGANKFVVTPTGKIGVGVANPTNLVDFYSGNTTTDIDISINHGAGWGKINFMDKTGGVGKWAIGGMGDTAPGLENTFFIQQYTDRNDVSVGDINRFVIDDSGRVGIGTNSPLAKLHVVGSGPASFPATFGTSQTGLGTRIQGANNNAILDIGGNSLSGAWLQSTNINDLSANYALLLNPNGGNIGIGTNSPTYKLDVNGTARIKDDLTVDNYLTIARPGVNGSMVPFLDMLNIGDQNGTGSTIRFQGSNSGYANQFDQVVLGGYTVDNTVNAEKTAFIIQTVKNGRTNLTEQFRIDYTGYIGLGGVTSPSDPIKASVAFANGASLSSAGVWTNGSDARLKKQVVNSKYGLNDVLKMRPVDYVMKNSNEHQVGFLAQEMKKIIPEVVTGKEGDLQKGETLGISYGNLVAVLVQAIKEIHDLFTGQQKEIAQLKNTIEQQQNDFQTQIQILNQRLEKLEHNK